MWAVKCDQIIVGYKNEDNKSDEWLILHAALWHIWGHIKQDKTLRMA